MYSNHGHQLDTPPPPSQLSPHRPWSPDPRDPFPSLRHQYSQQQQHLQVDDYVDSARYPLQRQEPSDDSVSVQALDLADYANTLRPWRGGLQSDQALEYPPSPPSHRPFSLDSFDRDVPSLSSSMDTPSTETSIPSLSSHNHRDNSSRRPTSLPAALSPSPTVRLSGSYAPPFIAQPVPSLDRVYEYPSLRSGERELDIAHFPAWSKSWYSKDERGGDLRSPLSKDDPRAAFFDPAYQSDSLPSHLTNPYSAANTLNSAPRSQPWGSTDQYGVPLGSDTKEERMRMLEHEFGAKTVGQPEVEESVVGGVNIKGKLITQGPMKRIATRVVEALMAFGIAASSIYAALEIKPSSTPPPQGKIYTYILYILSIVNVLVMFYLFAIRPCCGGRGKNRGANFTSPGGMMVMPVNAFPGGKKNKKGKKGQQGGDGVQVNLIVDPTMFNGPGSRQFDDEEEEDDEYGSSASFGTRRPRRQRRRTVFEGLAMEEQWLAARKELKWVTFADCLFFLLWAVEFVWILIGERCPSGEYDGWCTAYNVASALACLLAVTFGLSIFFDIKDLHTSKVSPRRRT